MALKQITEIESPLLGRKRYTFEIDHPGKATPKRAEIKEEIAKKVNTTPEKVAIRHIFTQFGAEKSKIIVYIYNDEKTLKRLEPPKGKKSAPKQKAAPAKK
ncbi:hypothetical protein HZB00_01480 [Candidatus Woesearchaeota archaeon]|nr:hypothetical protein [Candidatus Woesearchaeota archaeon]